MYHISKKGLAILCKKNGEDCNSLEHFDTIEEAAERSKEIMANEFAFIPDVKYTSTIVPNDEEVNILTQKLSELYVAVKYVKNNNVEPYICLGKDLNEENVYHVLYKDEGLFYDINGIIAGNEEDLETYIRELYEIESFWTLVGPESSIEMIQNLIGVNLQDEDSEKLLKRYLKKRLDQTIYYHENIALRFVLRELG